MKLFCEKCSKIFTVEPGESATVNCSVCGNEMTRPASDLSAGVVIGDFVIEKLLNKGGMGEVFLANQISLDRPVALKVLQSEFTNDQEYIDSLFREARAAARINHPNIVQAYAVGSDDGHFYLAMELVRGETLKKIIRENGPLAPVRAAEIIRDVAGALDVAWREQKLVHQDIKPDNIMVNTEGVAKLADLGLAKSATVKENTSEDSDEVMGTPQYISPEQLTGVTTDVRSDLYSLGATFYHIVTGKLPYRTNDMAELAQMHNSGNLTPPKQVKNDIPDELDRIIVKMMARDIGNRYQTPADLVSDLVKFIDAEKNAVKVGSKDASVSPRVTPKIVPKVAKPVIAAKPVVPAKPVQVAPVKPVETASPVVAEKPVIPVKPVAPAVPEKPVIPVNPVPVANPAAVFEPQGTPVAEKKSDDGENKNFPVRKVILIASLSLAGIVILVAVAAGVLFVLEKAKIMSPVVTPYIVKVIPALDYSEEVGNDDGVQAETAVVEEEKIPENLPTSASTLETFEVTGRMEFLTAFDEIYQWRQKNLDANEEFLKKVDAAWGILSSPIFPREKEALDKIKTMFSASDELLRCAEDRNRLRREHIDNLAAAEKAYAEQKEKEAKAKAERELKQQEFERQARENARSRQEDAKRDQKRLMALGMELSKHMSKCVVLMRESLFTGNDQAFKDAVTAAKIFAKAAPSFNQNEAMLLRQYNQLLNSLESEKKKLGVIFAKFKSINGKSGIRVVLERGSAPLIGMTAGELVYRDNAKHRDVVLEYEKLIPRTRETLFVMLTQIMGIKDSEFYCDLFHRKRPEDKKVPAGFWKKVWPMVKNSL
ncbi:MAG: protein kinase [Lentisphaeria bacterium]|nr:protein kinase [Lentisphaeria bacterium]